MADLKGKAGIVTGGSSGIGFQRAWEKAHRALST